MLLSKNISDRITFLRFPLIVAIVFIHIHTNDFHFTNKYFDYLTYYISEILARVSVPTFFALAGYLFFINLNPTFNGYLKKIHSRFYSLFIPYIFWNLFILLFFIIAQNNNLTAHYFSGERPIILNLSLIENIKLFFGFPPFKYPLAFQFWFIRDLIYFVLLSPIIAFVIKKFPYILLLVLFLEQPILYFSFGAFLAICNIEIKRYNNFASTSMLVFFIFSIICIFFQNDYFYNFTIFLGLITIFLSLKYIKMSKKLLDLSKYSFFLFAIHEPLLSILRKISLKIINIQNDFILLLIYIFIPIITIIISIYIYKFLQKFFPKFLNLITGSRS